jgi:hypothetical protein
VAASPKSARGRGGGAEKPRAAKTKASTRHEFDSQDKKRPGVWYGPWIQVPRDLEGQPDNYWTRQPDEDELHVEVESFVNGQFEGTYLMRVDQCFEDRSKGTTYLVGIFLKGSSKSMDEDAAEFLPGKFCLHLCGKTSSRACKFAHEELPTMHCYPLRRIIYSSGPELRGRQLVAVPSRRALGEVGSPSGSRPPAKRMATGVGGGVPVLSEGEESLAGAETAGAVAALKRRSGFAEARGSKRPSGVTLPAREGGDVKEPDYELPPGPPLCTAEAAEAARERGRQPEREAKLAELRERLLTARDRQATGGGATPGRANGRLGFIEEVQRKSMNDFEIKLRRRSRGRRRRRRRSSRSRSRSSESSSSELSGSSIERVFRGPRGTARTLAEVARRAPGGLTRSFLKAIRVYLQGRRIEHSSEEVRAQVSVFLETVLFPGMPELPARSQREMRTLGQCIDELLEGKVISALDTLVQRVKGLEQAHSEGSWSGTSFTELVPGGPITTRSSAEKEVVARERKLAARLTENERKAAASPRRE